MTEPKSAEHMLALIYDWLKARIDAAGRLLASIELPRCYDTTRVTVPGITTGAAYQDKDAIGTPFQFNVPLSGLLHGARYYDLDDEGLQVDLWLFDTQPASPADNSALALTDAELLTVICVVQFTTFKDAGNGQFSEVDAVGMGYHLTQERVWAQAQARGALNIAAANLPRFQLSIVPDR